MSTEFSILRKIDAYTLFENALVHGDLYGKKDIEHLKNSLGGQTVLNIIGGISLHLFNLCFYDGLDVQEAYDLSVELCASPPANKEQADSLEVNTYIESRFQVL